MTNCCGEDRNTPFCPMCGSRQHSPGLESLLGHCRHNLKMQINHIKRHEARASEDPDLYEPIDLRSLQVRNKWQSWVDLLEKVLEEPTDAS